MARAAAQAQTEAEAASARQDRGPAVEVQQRASWLDRLRSRLGRRKSGAAAADSDGDGDGDGHEDEDEDRPDPNFQDASTRRTIVAALWTGILLSVPLWWRTTTITRLPLPEHELAHWTQRGACPVRIPVHLRLHLPQSATPSIYPYYDEAASPSTLYHSEHDFLAAFREQLVRDLDEASGRTSHPADEAVAQDDSCIDWRIAFDDESKAEDISYDVLFTGQDSATRGLGNVAASLHLNHTFPPSPSPPLSASAIASDLRHLFHLPLRTLPLSDTRAIQYSRPLRLVFSLLNEDATRGGAVAGWELERALEESEMQQLVESLRGVYDVVVESQVLWYAPLAFQPTREEHVHVLERSGDCDGDPAPPVSENEEESEASSRPAAQDSDITDAGEVEALLQAKPATPARRTTKPCVIRNRTDTQWLVEWEDLKVFVNAAAWSLTSAVSSLRPVGVSSVLSPDSAGERSASTSSVPALVEEEEKTLHLLLYLPAADQRPLHVRDPGTGNASAAHAWMVPQWGGVVLLNLDAAAAKEASRKGEVGPALVAEELREPIRLWTDQLRTLLGVRADLAAAPFCGAPPSDGASTCIPRRLPSDLLAIRRIVESARDAVATLQSTVRLVHKIPNLGVGKEVRGDVQGALELLTQLDMSLHASPALPTPSAAHETHSPSQAHRELQRALALASLASTLASRAFFHPNMLGLLYFPEEHKYAVYTPLFGPVAVPLLVALVREIKGWRKGRRRQREQKAKTD